MGKLASDLAEGDALALTDADVVTVDAAVITDDVVTITYTDGGEEKTTEMDASTRLVWDEGGAWRPRRGDLDPAVVQKPEPETDSPA